jgi:hypothetical protein
VRGELHLGVVLSLDQLLFGPDGHPDADAKRELGCVNEHFAPCALVDAPELAAGGRPQPCEHLPLGLSVAGALGPQAGLLERLLDMLERRAGPPGSDLRVQRGTPLAARDALD